MTLSLPGGHGPAVATRQPALAAQSAAAFDRPEGTA